MKTNMVIILLLASSALAGQNSVDYRFHYVVADHNRSPLYYVTAIERRDERQSSEIYLILNTTTGQRLQIDVERDYRTHESTTEYSLDGKHSAKVRLQLPFIAATTFQETVEEGKKHKELFDADVPITVESTGHSEKMTEKMLKSESSSGDAHRRAKNAVGDTLSAAVTSALAVLSFPQIHGACSTVELVTDGQKCVGDTRFMIATVTPDCAFDADFGRPCGPEHSEKAKAIAASGTERPY